MFGVRTWVVLILSSLKFGHIHFAELYNSFFGNEDSDLYNFVHLRPQKSYMVTEGVSEIGGEMEEGWIVRGRERWLEEGREKGK